MAIINYVKREVIAKVVYYGPGLCGKTTNLVRVHENMGAQDTQTVGQMQQLATESDRTLFFDFVPIQLGKIAGFEARFQLFTVPGQVFYNETRRVVLKDCDGIVFVADSQPSALVNNIESMQNLEENLASHGKSLEDLPMVIQYNKQDLPDAMTAEELEEVINTKYNVPSMKASAFENWGVMESLAKISTLVLEHLRETMANPKAAAPSRNVKRTYSKETVNDDDVVGDLLSDIAAARTGQPQETGIETPRKEGAVPGSNPVETSSIKPEDLLAEFDEPSAEVTGAPPPAQSAPQPARQAAPAAPQTEEAATQRVPTPMPAPPPPPQAEPTAATKANVKPPPPPPGGSQAGGRTAEDLLASLEDDEPAARANGNGELWEDSTRLTDVPPADSAERLDAGDSTKVSLEVPQSAKEPPSAETLNPFDSVAAPEDEEQTGRQVIPPDDAPPPPPPAPPPPAPAEPPMPEASLDALGAPAGGQMEIAPPAGGLAGAPVNLTLVDSGPARPAGPGMLMLPLTLKNERDGSLTTVTLNMTTDDLPASASGGGKQKGGGASVAALILAIIAFLMGAAALGLTLAPDLLQNP